MFHFLKHKNKESPVQIQPLATGITLQVNIPQKVAEIQPKRKNLISHRWLRSLSYLQLIKMMLI